MPFSRELYIEQDDFREDPPKKFFRLSPGHEVRLRCAYFITCTEVVKDAQGEVVELRCTYDPATRGGDAPDGRKVKATLHWVSASHALPVEVRLYDRLFTAEDPEKTEPGRTFLDHLNPAIARGASGCQAEPSLRGAPVASRFQFERLGYFCVDPDSTAGDARLQPHGVAPRYVGQDRTKAAGLAPMWVTSARSTTSASRRWTRPAAAGMVDACEADGPHAGIRLGRWSAAPEPRGG